MSFTVTAGNAAAPIQPTTSSQSAQDARSKAIAMLTASSPQPQARGLTGARAR
jgi:hypothetical protein